MKIFRFIILLAAIVYVVLHIVWSNQEEFFPGAIEVDDLLFILSSGYFVSYIFYYVYVARPLHTKRKNRQELAKRLLCTIVFSCQEIGRVLNLKNGFEGCSGRNISNKMDIIKSGAEFDMNIFSLTRSGEARLIKIDDYIIRYCKLASAICEKYIFFVEDEFQELIPFIMECTESARDVITDYEYHLQGFDTKHGDWHRKIPTVFYRTQDLIAKAKKVLDWPIDTTKESDVKLHIPLKKR
ncbi:hypothetical protein EDC59_11123 [Pseudodesulfovibrio indicus]|nr:hypothetical protein [Pseudodesulfovibrio indicus]TDT86705.1 hypothetical protein EDC59_11123 [Pseudodesulfovibrio indicus]